MSLTRRPAEVGGFTTFRRKRPKPPCRVCGKTVRTHEKKYCSYACSKADAGAARGRAPWKFAAPTLAEAVALYTDRPEGDSGCWIFRGTKNVRGGYGVTRDPRAPVRRDVYAHRLVYEFFVAAIPDGLVIDHLCRNPPCVNPDHMELVTIRENSLRGEAPSIQSHRSGLCKRGHSLDDNPIRIGTLRTCRVCARDKANSRRRARRDIPPATREALALRSGGRCERCGRRANHAHHRQLRSQGGHHVVANLAHLCWDCHHTVHSGPRVARLGGWLVLSTDAPSQVPVTLWDGHRVLLTPDGQYEDTT